MRMHMCAAEQDYGRTTNPPRIDVLWSLNGSYAKPNRGSKFRKDGLFLKTLGTWTKPVPLTKSVMALSGCLTVTGSETKLYRKPRFKVSFGRTRHSSCT